jgi:hypothetical protein
MVPSSILASKGASPADDCVGVTVILPRLT